MADNVEIQGLEFQIIGDSVSAEDSLNKLKETLVNLKNAVKGGVSGVRTTAKQIEALKIALSGFDNQKITAMKEIAGGLKELGTVGKVRLPTTVSKRIAELKTALSGFSTSDGDKLRSIAGGLTALGAIGQVRISSTIATQLTALKPALDGLDVSHADKLTTLAGALRPLSEIGRAHLTPLINQLGKLPDLIRELDKVDLTKFTHQMEDLAAAMKPFADEMAKVASGFAAFPSRIQRLITSTEQYNNVVKKATKQTGLWGKAMKALSWASIITALRRVATLIADCIEKSNSYQEDLNLFTVALGQYAEEAQAYAQKVSDAMGIDTGEWMRAQGVFNTLLTGFGNVSDRAYTMSTNLTQLGYDLASFFNISVADAMQKLQSGISGELEPLRRLGYDLSQARLEAVALSLGIDKAVSAMTQAEKAELRYYAIMTQVTTAQGDMARTLQSPANQLRILKAQLEMCARSIGNIFIPALNAILPYAIAVVQALREIADAVASLFGFELTEVDYSGIGDLTSGATEGADAMGEVTDEVEDTTKALKKLKQYTMGFDELNIISPNTDTSAVDDLTEALEGTSGSGFGFELPTYDFLGDAVNTRVEEIRKQLEPTITWIKEHLEEILTLAKAIGIVFLAWKIGTGIITGIQTILTAWDTLKKVGSGLKAIVSAIKGYMAAVQAAKMLDPSLTTLQAMFPKISSWLAGVGTTLKSAWASISAFFAGIPGMVFAGVGLIIAGVPTFIKGLYDALKDGLDWLSGTLIAAGATATGAGVGAIIGALGGPIGMGVGALIGLAVGLITDFTIWLVQNWDEVCAWFSDVGQKIGDFLADCWEGIKSVWSEVCTWFDTNVIQPVTQFFTNLWQNIVGIWNTAAEWFNTNVLTPVTNAFKAVTDWIGTFFEGCWIIVQAVWIVASDWFKTKIIEPIQKWFEKMTTKVRTFFTEAWTKVKNAWSVATDWFNTHVIVPVRDGFIELTTKIREKFSEAWQKVKDTWASVKEWFNVNIVQPVRTKFVELTTKLSQLFSDAWGKVKNAWSVAKDWFKNSVIDPVVQRFQTAVQKIRSAFENAFTGIKNFVKNIFNSVIASVEGVINRVISGFNNLISKFNRVVEWAADIVGTNWRGLSTISLVSLPRLADGGFVDEGQLFIAREKGAEMVGSMNNRTTVANNEQIVDGIRAGVYEAVIAAMGNMQQTGEMIVKVFLDGKEVTANVEKHQRERGVSIMGGVVYG